MTEATAFKNFEELWEWAVNGAVASGTMTRNDDGRIEIDYDLDGVALSHTKMGIGPLDGDTE